MYRVILKDNHLDNAGKILHEPQANGNKLISGKGVLRLQGTDSFVADIPSNNDHYRAIKPFKSLIEIYNIYNQETIFEGRIIDHDISLDAGGYHFQNIVVEGMLGYFRDSSQRYARFQNKGARDLLEYIVNDHNTQVEPHKRFIVGEVTMESVTDAPYRWIGYGKTFDVLRDMLLRDIGGYFIVRRNEEKQLVIDWLKEVGEKSDTKFEYGQNIIKARRTIDVSQLITVIEPLGADLDRSNNIESELYGSQVTRPRLDIKSVNNGSPFLRDEKLIEEFGVIIGQVDFTEISEPRLLKNRGQQYLDQQSASFNSWELDVVDRSLIDPFFDPIKIGNQYETDIPMISAPEFLQVTERGFDVVNFDAVSIKVGSSNVSLSKYQLINRESKESMLKYQQMQIEQIKKQNLINSINLQIQAIVSEIERLERQKQQLIADEATQEEINAITDNINAKQSELVELQNKLAELNNKEADNG
ncbi:phage tail protein [Facklamia sp. P13064]|uniref:phage tail protein n=1 Tax=Facklamia sp. P13064 TaxID=3421953 RepID=UPI003D16294D